MSVIVYTEIDFEESPSNSITNYLKYVYLKLSERLAKTEKNEIRACFWDIEKGIMQLQKAH